MHPIDYLLLRLARHFMPQSIAHLLLKKNFIIHPGAETRTPLEAVDRYQKTLKGVGRTVTDQRILDFGYGGNFSLACGLLEAGASHVTLVDKYALPDHHSNQRLLPTFEKYLIMENGQVTPRPDFIDLYTELQPSPNFNLQPFDLVLSNSVYEHLDDVDRITRTLAELTKQNGCQLHFVDLRDHYFKYPFEMLTFSENAWKRWFNPGSNLNRMRIPDYVKIFEKYFKQVGLTILEHDREHFERTRSRIKPAFLTGDPQIDSATLIQICITQ
jgi:hypothetical protein